MRFAIAAAVASLLVPLPGLAQDFSGRVITVRDGDSVVVRTPQQRKIEVRLADIDAPERGQPYADRSRQLLSDLVLGKNVRVVYRDTDTYGRIVARLYAGDVDISAEMVGRGAAWVYRAYARDRRLFALEDAARTAKRGLWGSSEANVPPWEWRHGAGPLTQAPRELPTAFSCGTKTVCRQMTSCDEAQFYLNRCGVTSLDGNEDGVACNALCR